jgi:type II secretory pathway pseudopilin PulG
MLKRMRERGDTLIEVLFAVSVFSFVVVGSLAIMNQGTAASQRSLETTLVRQEIDAQAEALRFMHDAYVSVYHSGITFDTGDGTTSPAEEWYRMRQHVETAYTTGGIRSASDFSVGEQCPTPPNYSFIIDTRNAIFRYGGNTLQPADNIAALQYSLSGNAYQFNTSEGIWIEAIRSDDSTDTNQQNTGFIDFHIRACWPGTGIPTASSRGTIVRLYEPRG